MVPSPSFMSNLDTILYVAVFFFLLRIFPKSALIFKHGASLITCGIPVLHFSTICGIKKCDIRHILLLFWFVNINCI